jgi:hypothetical protein
VSKRLRDELASLRAENDQFRRFIASSESIRVAEAAVEYKRLYDDLTARCTAAMNALQESATIDLGICPFCGESWPTVGCDAERRMAIAAEHDQRCAKNPLKIERDALRRAVIDLYHLQFQRAEDATEAWAIRQTANDLSAPFSDERVRARLAAALAKEQTP